MKLIFKILVTLFIITNTSLADEIKVFDFTETELSKLEVRKVRGADNKTIYSVGSNENGNFLKAVADNAASGLGKEIKIDLNKTPFINITWKIENQDDYFVGRSLDVFITKLRKYFKDDSRIIISNLHGVGFKFEIPE